MSRKRPSQTYPRPDLIAELTHGIPLPHTPIAAPILGLIAERIELAWQDLRTRHQPGLLSGSEAEINALLAIRLNALIEEDVYWRSLVSSVIPTPGLPSYDGRHIEKKPDLVIQLTVPQRPRHPSFGLHVECKLIDHPHNKTVDLYCRDGLARFVKGEYAWTAREAFMLAYVRDGSIIEGSLTPYLATAKTATFVDPYQTVDLPSAIAPPPWERACTSHGRPFRYSGTNTSPGPITLLHLWLKAA